MNHALRGKLTVLLALVAVIIGLTSLGMRVPALKGFTSSSKPSPRPRAITQNQVKNCNETIKKLNLQAMAVVPARKDTVPEPIATAQHPTSPALPSILPPVSEKPSRAPPVHS